MSKESFILFKSFYEPTRHLSLSQKGELYDAIFQYQIDQIEPKPESTIYPFFLFFKNQFRLDGIKYEKRTNANKANGLKGGRPKKDDNPNKPKNPMGLKKAKKGDNDNDNDNDNDKDNKKNIIKKDFENEVIKKASSKKFIKPTLEQVQDYCFERQNKVDPEKFVNHYTSNGWKVGRMPMKDWRAAVRTWEKNDFNNGNSKYGIDF
jgi:hypothetical protein